MHGGVRLPRQLVARVESAETSSIGRFLGEKSGHQPTLPKQSRFYEYTARLQSDWIPIKRQLLV
jgi:hypothetical protein